MRNVAYIVIPGLGDQRPVFGWFYKRVEKRWARNGLHTQIFASNWGKNESYERKCERLHEEIISVRATGREVILVGVSAGAALGLLAFCQGREEASGFISICGFTRLSQGDRKNPRLMQLSWYQAANQAEQELTKVPHTDRKRIMSIYGRRDDVIEIERQHIEGAVNKQIPSVGHVLSIVVALWFYRREIAKFATSKDLV